MTEACRRACHVAFLSKATPSLFASWGNCQSNDPQDGRISVGPDNTGRVIRRFIKASTSDVSQSSTFRDAKFTAKRSHLQRGHLLLELLIFGTFNATISHEKNYMPNGQL